MFFCYANEESYDIIGGFNKTVSPEILEQCSSNLAPELYVTKETEWLLLCCCHGNNLGSSFFL